MTSRPNGTKQTETPRRLNQPHEAITAAQENLRVQTLGYQEQQTTSLDVIDARLSLGAARVERAQAAYEYDVDLAKLLEVSGQSGRFGEYIKNADEVVNP